MTKWERAFVRQVVGETEHPAVPHAGFDAQRNRKEHRPLSEVERLLDSEDFRLGWELCRAAMKEQLEFALVAKPAELKRATRPEYRPAQ